MSPLALALVKLAIAAAPLAAMAKLARIYPGRRMVLLALAPALSTLALVATPAAMWLVVILDVVFAAAVVVDVWSLPARRDFSVHRHTQRIASLQKRHAVTLTVSNHAGRAHRLEVRDGVPHVLQPTPSDFAETLAAGSRLVCEYHLRPSRRGAFDLDAVHLRAISRRRLWSRLLDYPCPSTIHVYPDMKQLSQYAVLARTDRLNLVGVRRVRRVADARGGCRPRSRSFVADGPNALVLDAFRRCRPRADDSVRLTPSGNRSSVLMSGSWSGSSPLPSVGEA